MPAADGSMTLKERRAFMAKKFEATQNEMSDYVDQCSVARRAPVPYPSTWKGTSVSEHGPIPTDAHLIPSNLVIFKKQPPSFQGNTDTSGAVSKLGGLPYASFRKEEGSVFTETAASSTSATAAAATTKIPINEEMWRTQYQEWTLQKNAYNPDIAAAMRTNVRKQASLMVVDPELSQDPARSSENVKAALTHAEETGPAPPRPKGKLRPAHYLPQAMATG